MEEKVNGTNGTAESVKQHAAEVFTFGEDRMRTLASAIVERVQFAQMHGLTFGGKRNLYEILGYAENLTTRDFGQRYARGGLAGRIVDVYPNATWRGEVEVYEDDDPKILTKFEAAWKDLDRQHQVQSKLLRVDKLSLLSTYAVLLIGAGDADLREELPKGSPGKVLYLTPYSGGGTRNSGQRSPSLRNSAYDADVNVFEYDEDPNSKRFNLPLTYQLRRAAGSKTSDPLTVHWSRIIHVAENLLWDEVYGIPALERVWNLLDDLEKVTGGGAEAFWMRANAGMLINLDKDMTFGQDRDAQLADMRQQIEDYKHQLTRVMRMRGVEVSQLGSDVANFNSPADAIITQIAGAKGIPKRILTGSEMGELASSQDRENWKDQVNGRQTQYAGPYILRPLVDRLIAYGYLPTPKDGPESYKIEWPHVQVLTEQEKADGASKWAQVNKEQGEIVFPNDEIRDHWYGYAPLTEEQKQPPVPPASPSASTTDSQDAIPANDTERQLLMALEKNDTDALDALLGLTRPEREAER